MVSLNPAMFCRLEANSIFEFKFQRVSECKLELTRNRNLSIGSKFQARKSEKNEMMKWMYTVQSKAYSISESL